MSYYVHVYNCVSHQDLNAGLWFDSLNGNLTDHRSGMRQWLLEDEQSYPWFILVFIYSQDYSFINIYNETAIQSFKLFFRTGILVHI